MKLSRPQIDMLRLHLGTTRKAPRRRKYGAGVPYTETREFHFPTHPTAMALHKRGLLDWRGFDGKTAGGWFITKAGIGALC